MYCKNCGVKLKDDAKFCKQCGIPVNNNVKNFEIANTVKKNLPVPLENETMNISQSYISKLNMSMEFIRKINNLRDDVKKLETELEAMKNILGIKAFLKQNPDKKSQCHGLSIAFYILAIVLFLLADPLGMLLFPGLIVVFVAFLFLGLFFSCVASSKDKKIYEHYKWEEHLKYQKKYDEYQKKYNELMQLKNMMSNNHVCIIPFNYWGKADIIYTYILNGAAQSVEEAIAQLGL